MNRRPHPYQLIEGPQPVEVEGFWVLFIPEGCGLWYFLFR
ncbi:hypothetical protein HMPREF0372_03117 [Flavonifractor plautii ATCC 29863]|uniref:Uncharacterized protein n=1 Tax=Flavonifractor plautii ATCC 29863 TaxID=411475 RepID=G9YUA9_FLAPL|nr:hypothetical protein HMPREF0372_03117 [Flavonifractor plautii ATCC 29863]